MPSNFHCAIKSLELAIMLGVGLTTGHLVTFDLHKLAYLTPDIQDELLLAVRRFDVR